MYKCGDKFSITNCSIDVEIIGVFPKSQSQDGKEYYVATLNGEKMKVALSFIEMLQNAQTKEKENIKKESKKNGRRK